MFVGAAGFYRGKRLTRKRLIKSGMQLKQELVIVADFTITKKMAPLFGIYSLSLLLKMKTERPSNSLGKYIF